MRGQLESGDVKTSAEEFVALFRRVSEAPTRLGYRDLTVNGQT